MKQQWAPAELIDHWTLTPEERQLVTTASKTDYNQLGCAVLFKSFQLHGKFPQRKQDIPPVIVEHVAQQLRVQVSQFERYDFRKLAAKRHRGHIRRFLHVRRGTVADANAVSHWFEVQNQLLEDHNLDRLQEVVYERYKELNIEPPLPKRVDRLIRSAVRSADEWLYAKILSRLLPETQKKLDGLLGENVSSGSNSPLSDLKNEAGAATPGLTHL
jgi:hypothetical protein